MSMTVGGLPPPPGITPNFINPYSLQRYNVVTQSVCFTTSTIFVSARLFTKIRFTPPLGPEDYTCFIAWLGLLAYGMLDLVSDAYGNGIHLWNVPMPHAVRWAQLANVHEIIYGPIVLITKMSILLLYSKLFAPQRKSVTYFLIRLLIYFNALFYTSITLVKIFECTPRRKIWVKKTPGHCINLAELLYVTGTVNTCSDIAILILPLSIIWRLQLPTNRKISVSAAFTPALFAPIASIMRLASSIKGAASEDATYAIFGIALWTQAEITTGVICSCLPTLFALYRHYDPKIRSLLTSGHRGGHINQSAKVSKRSAFSSRGMIPTARYRDHDDPYLLRDEYLEMGAVSGYENPGASNGPVTTIEGGANADVGTLDSDGQVGNAEGITMTVRLETIPLPPPSFQGLGTRRL